ncbi:hypothetical protein ACFXA4_12815 [Streptomyces sp. NPDC059442]|uniref:hypothetical protein n=1 Tax=Streptomyces sp. NPDC059442 TaxID=3346830 RepID=UPI00367511F6
MTLVTMVPLSADRSSPLRYLLVPLLVLSAVALVAAALVASRDGGRDARPGDATRLGAPGEARTTQAAGRRPAPQGGIATSRSPSRVPATTPAPARTRPRGTTPTPRPSRSPSPAASPVPFDRLRAGECFDIDRSAPGTVTRRSCVRPHDAQVVAVLRLTGDHDSDEAVRDAAAALCRDLLRRKAADQPRGTRWTTFVQYPFRTSYLLGTDTVACSLAVNAGTGSGTGDGTDTGDDATAAVRKLTAPLL